MAWDLPKDSAGRSIRQRRARQREAVVPLARGGPAVEAASEAVVPLARGGPALEAATEAVVPLARGSPALEAVQYTMAVRLLNRPAPQPAIPGKSGIEAQRRSRLERCGIGWPDPRGSRDRTPTPGSQAAPAGSAGGRSDPDGKLCGSAGDPGMAGCGSMRPDGSGSNADVDGSGDGQPAAITHVDPR